MISKIFFLILILAASITAQTSSAESDILQNLAKWRSANYSDVKYRLNITLEKGAPLMEGTIKVSVLLTEEGAKNDLVLDWRTTQFENDKDKPYIGVSQVNGTMMGKSSGNNDKDLYWIEAEHLFVEKRFLKKGENIIELDFAVPIKTSGASITRYTDRKDGAEYIYSQFLTGRSTPFPMFDQTDLKAQFILKVKAPAKWKVISNPKMITVFDGDYFDTPENDDVKNGDYNVVFEQIEPISPDAFAFAAGDFAEFKDTADIGPTKTAPIGSSIIYEPRKNPNAAKIYVRKSQAEKFKKYELEFFRSHRKTDKSAKLDIISLPEISNVRSDYEGIKFLPESSVFK